MSAVRQRLRIAGLQVGLTPEGLATFAPGADLEPFLVDPEGPEDLSVRLAAGGGKPAFARGARTFAADRVWELYASGDGQVLRWAPHGSGRLRIEARFSRDYAQGELRMDPWPGELSLAGFPLLEIAFQSRLARLGGGFLVHALGLDLEGRGVLLPGSSGRGKSTLAAAFGPGEALSDERVAVGPDPAGPRIHGTPWRGTARRIHPGGAPLRAVVFLGPHEGPHGLRALGPAEAYRRLVFHAFPPFWDRAGLEQVLDLALRVAREVPCYELRFDKDADPRPVLEEAVGRRA